MYEYAHGDMADSPDNDCGWCYSSFVNMGDHNASSEIVTGCSAAPHEFPWLCTIQGFRYYLQ